MQSDWSSTLAYSSQACPVLRAFGKFVENQVRKLKKEIDKYVQVNFVRGSCAVCPKKPEEFAQDQMEHIFLDTEDLQGAMHAELTMQARHYLRELDVNIRKENK